MKTYIETEPLKKFILDRISDDNPNTALSYDAAVILSYIESAPKKIQHNEPWIIEKANPSIQVYTCPICGRPDISSHNFCPACGNNPMEVVEWPT